MKFTQGIFLSWDNKTPWTWKQTRWGGNVGDEKKETKKDEKVGAKGHCLGTEMLQVRNVKQLEIRVKFRGLWGPIGHTGGGEKGRGLPATAEKGKNLRMRRKREGRPGVSNAIVLWFTRRKVYVPDRQRNCCSSSLTRRISSKDIWILWFEVWIFCCLVGNILTLSVCVFCCHFTFVLLTCFSLHLLFTRLLSEFLLLPITTFSHLLLFCFVFLYLSLTPLVLLGYFLIFVAFSCFLCLPLPLYFGFLSCLVNSLLNSSPFILYFTFTSIESFYICLNVGEELPQQDTKSGSEFYHHKYY